MNIELITKQAELATFAAVWDQLAGDNPFLGWHWMSAWWKQYADEDQLYVLIGRDPDGNVVGIAPWLLNQTDLRGRVIQFLGGGKPCTDHLGLLCDDGHVNEFAAACAQWLDQADPSTEQRWDYLELIGADQDNASIAALAQALNELGHRVAQTPGLACYYLNLAAGWEGYYSSRSQSAKRMLRKLQKTLDQPNIHAEVYSTPAQILEHWPIFVMLHQQRRRANDEVGCFDHPGFNEFLKSATIRLAEQGRVRLYVIYAGDIPISVSHTLVGSDRLYNYHSGMDPDYDPLRPGFLVLATVLQDLETLGLQGLDMLRGEEVYKQRWRGDRIETVELRVPSRRTRSVALHQLWRTSETIKDFLRSESTGSQLS